MMIKAALFFITISLVSNDVFCQASKQRNFTIRQELPSVFQLGEFEEQTEALVKDMPTLLDACNGDMEVAYNKLVGMMSEMQEQARTSGFEINGLQVWLQFFWNPDGSLSHIGYYLKPNSRNVDDKQLRTFLGNFINKFRLPIRSSKQFTHYASFSFPLAYLPAQEPQRLAKTTKPGSRN